MNKRIGYGSMLQGAVITMGLALLLSCGFAYAEKEGEKYTPSLLMPPAEVDQSLLNRRLQIARKDIEAFQVFAENFRNNGDPKGLAQLQNPADDFLAKHLDNLFERETEHSPIEATRLTAEIMFIKARLFMALNRGKAARDTIAEMKKRFSAYQKISVELPGKTTTLDKGIRLLDEELAKTAAAAKK